ncbi:hypothetical protein [Neptunitalea lumnitzerae]|uniref:Lipoprotein n=1 Tax=Neptunitalea lumnitzerae TaxID=2965509 RepID=A0ABQ5MHL4_9FLAO|nr:hypothetical protein [Neptunitalea sp. Y10]GLB48883.1 hypothetical protein Y10_12510 [Neptunitalea sp. Y10]
MKSSLYKIALILTLSITVVLSCTSDKEKPFLITKEGIGLLTPSTRISQLDTIFQKDSISESAYEGELRYASTERYHIFTKEGNPLMEITPSQDSIKTISNIRIISDLYHTKAGISTKSTFGDITKNYTISSIQNTWNSVIISINELDVYFTIDKKMLDSKFKNNSSVDITAEDIPSDTPIKYFMISWN